MPDFFLELFSEEIPGRMQSRAAADLDRLTAEALAPLSPAGLRTWFGPRRIALAATIAAEVPATRSSERGPRASAPEQAIAGFLRKHGASRDDLRIEGDFYVLDRASPAVPAAALLAQALPPLLRRFPWPKSMRWGGTSHFTWVRPLRRIACLLDGAVVRFDLREGADDAHGLASDNLTEGHRFLSPGVFAVESAGDWATKLRERYVLVDAAERKALIAEGLAELAAEHGLTVADDPGLLEEVAGLVEWPVPMLGRIDPAYMDLPPEVMQVSMRVNQRYFALRDASGAAAPFFGFAANIVPADGGAATIAGNERVLRARFADARHFWDLDRRTPLLDRVPTLGAVTFHARLVSQGDRVSRLVRLAGEIGPLVGADFHLAERADAVPTAPVSIAVAVADKLDKLAQFFNAGEKPTGSGDPYALRRAALGVLRIARENGLRLRLRALLLAAGANDPDDLLGFLAERMRVQLRAEGARHDVLDAVFAAGSDDDIVRLLARTTAIATLLGSEDGANLLTAYRRAANILRIEERKDGAYEPTPDAALFTQSEERTLSEALSSAEPLIAARLETEDFTGAMSAMATLRSPLDAFFDHATVNAPEAGLRRNRLALLARVRAVIDRVAHFSKIEG